jgi:hypothetical protein
MLWTIAGILFGLMSLLIIALAKAASEGDKALREVLGELERQDRL